MFLPTIQDFAFVLILLCFDRSEYITIVSIMICMMAWDFVIGVLFGIVVSCEHCLWNSERGWNANMSLNFHGFFFMIQNSQMWSIHAIHTGDTTMSAIHRPSLQQAYIQEVSKQTTILCLHGV